MKFNHYTDFPTAAEVLEHGNAIKLTRELCDDDLQHILVDCAYQLYLEAEPFKPEDTRNYVSPADKRLTPLHDRASNAFAFAMDNSENPENVAFFTYILLAKLKIPLFPALIRNYSAVHTFIEELLRDEMRNNENWESARRRNAEFAAIVRANDNIPNEVLS